MLSISLNGCSAKKIEYSRSGRTSRIEIDKDTVRYLIEYGIDDQFFSAVMVNPDKLETLIYSYYDPLLINLFIDKKKPNKISVEFLRDIDITTNSSKIIFSVEDDNTKSIEILNNKRSSSESKSIKIYDYQYDATTKIGKFLDKDNKEVMTVSFEETEDINVSDDYFYVKATLADSGKNFLKREYYKYPIANKEDWETLVAAADGSANFEAIEEILLFSIKPNPTKNSITPTNEVRIDYRDPDNLWLYIKSNKATANLTPDWSKIINIDVLGAEYTALTEYAKSIIFNITDTLTILGLISQSKALK